MNAMQFGPRHLSHGGSSDAADAATLVKGESRFGALEQAGFLTYGSTYSPRLPDCISGIVRFSSPFTVAGQRRILTFFPIISPVAVHRRREHLDE